MNTSPPVEKHSINYTIQPWRLISATLWGICLAGLLPHQIHADDLYHRAEQTDADYAPKRIEELREKLKSSDSVDSVWEDSPLTILELLGPEARSAGKEIIQQLDNDKIVLAPWRVRDFVDETLGKIGVEVIPNLKEKYQTASSDQKVLILDALRLMGHDAREFLPLLINDYQQEKENQATLLSAIAIVDPKGEIAIPLLLKVVRSHEDEFLRSAAIEVLAHKKSLQAEWALHFSPAAEGWFDDSLEDSKEVVDLLIGVLGDNSAEVRAAAVSTLSTYSQHEDRIVDSLLPLLKDHAEISVMLSHHIVSSSTVSNSAVTALSQLSDSSDHILPQMLIWHNEGDSSMGYGPDVADTFAKLIPQSKDPLTHLRRLLESKNPQVALLTIARMGKNAQPVVGRVGDLLNHKDKKVRSKALITIACVDPRWRVEAIEMMRGISKAARDEEAVQNAPPDQIPPDQLWETLVSFLSQIGENARFTGPMIMETYPLHREGLEYGEFDHRVEMWSIYAEPTDGRFDQIFSHPDFDAYSLNWMEDSLLKMGRANPDYFHKMLTKPETSALLRIVALKIVSLEKSESPNLIPPLAAQLDSPHPAVREATVETLGQMQVEKSKVVEILTKANKDPRVRVRAKALEVLSSFGADAKSALPQIQAALSDDYLTVQIAAIRCLGELGKVATPTIGELGKLTKSETFLLRDEAKIALKKIRQSE